MVNTQFFPLAWLLFFFTPKIAVDGQEMPVPGWGRTHLPARPGQHHVQVHVPYFLPSNLGQADADGGRASGSGRRTRIQGTACGRSARARSASARRSTTASVSPLRWLRFALILLFLVILLTIVVAAV